MKFGFRETVENLLSFGRNFVLFTLEFLLPRRAGSRTTQRSAGQDAFRGSLQQTLRMISQGLAASEFVKMAKCGS